MFLQHDKLTSKKLFDKVDFFETRHKGHAVELAEFAAKNNYRYIIAAGGDGTINEVMNGIMNSGMQDQVILGHFTAGTANDFSKTIGITGKYEQLFDLIEHQKTKKIDVGEITYTDNDGKIDKRYFINIADVGIGGVVVEKINKSRKIFGPDFTFLSAITRTYLTYKKTELEVIADNNYKWQGKALSIVAANGKYFGSGLCIAPGAMIDDDKLSLVILGDVKLMDYVTKINEVRKGKTIEHPQVVYRTMHELQVNHIDKPTAIDIDGEFVGYTPCHIRILPGRINFLVP